MRDALTDDVERLVSIGPGVAIIGLNASFSVVMSAVTTVKLQMHLLQVN